MATRNFNIKNNETFFFSFYFVDSIAVGKGLVCCSRRPHTLDKGCRFTVAESRKRIERVALGDIGNIL